MMSPRQRLKAVFFSAARLCGANWVARRSLRRRLTVLGYHGVVPDDAVPDELRVREAVTLTQFRQQMRFVRRCFHPVSPRQVLQSALEAQPLPDFPLLVTFDDGFRNNLTCAAPELERQGIPALFLVATGYLGQDRLLWPHEIDERILRRQKSSLPMPGGSDDAAMPQALPQRMALAETVRGVCKRLNDDDKEAYLQRLRDEPLRLDDSWCDDLYAFMTWDEVRELAGRGFEIGAHTVNHPILSRVSAERMVREIRDSKSSIERELSRPCRFLAYPNGGVEDVGEEVFRAARQAGIDIALTLSHRFNRMPLEPLAIDRICIVRDLTTNVFQAHLSSLVARLRRDDAGSQQSVHR